MEVDNLAVPGAEVADLLQLVEEDPVVRNSVSGADAVLITIGWNDLAFNRLDDACAVAPNSPRFKWSEITHACVDAATVEYRRDLDTVLARSKNSEPGSRR